MEHTNLPWVEKYRPDRLTDIVSHQEILKTCRCLFFFNLRISVTRFIENEQIPHLLFYGPPGTGKTTAILAVTRTIFSDKERVSNVLELNASDDRGINVVR